MPKSKSIRVWDSEMEKWRAPLGYLLQKLVEDPPQTRYVFQFGCHIRDKNDREIMEGDIIEVDLSGPHTLEEYWFPIYLVIHDGWSYQLKYLGGDKGSDTAHFRLRYYSRKGCEVIGNMFSNPELLTKDGLKSRRPEKAVGRG